MADSVRALLEDRVTRYAPELPVELALAVYGQESSYGANTTTSPAGAIGGFQVTPTAARAVGIDPAQLGDKETNIKAGLQYLEKQYLQSGKDPFSAAARYFGGPDAMKNLAVTDVNKVSRGQYATQVMDRYRRLGGSVADSTSNELVKEPPGAAPTRELSGGYLDELMKAWGVSAQSTAGAVNSIQNAINVSTEETNTMVESTFRSGSLAYDIILSKARQEEAKAANAARNAATAGISKDDANSLFAELVAEYNMEADTARTAQMLLREKGRIGFLDDPLGFLQANYVDIPNITKEHNQAVTLANQHAERLSTLNSLVQTQNTTDAVQFTELSAQSAIKAAEAAAEKATMEAARLRGANAVQIAQLSVNTATLENKGLNELQQMEAMQFQRAQRLMIENLNAEKLDKIMADREQKAIFERDLASQGYTVPQFNALNANAKTILAQILATGKFGNDPAHALANAGILPSTRLTVGQGLVGTQIGRFIRQIPIPAQITKAEDKLNYQGSETAKEFQTRHDNAQDPRNGENLYHAPSPTKMLPMLNENFTETAKKVIKVISEATSGTPVDDMKIIESLVKSIGQEGYTRENSIQDISRYYATAVKVNNEVYRFKDWSLPAQTGYKAQFNLGSRIPQARTDTETEDFKSMAGLFATQIKVDLANETAVSSLVTLLQARDTNKFSPSRFMSRPVN